MMRCQLCLMPTGAPLSQIRPPALHQSEVSGAVKPGLVLAAML